MDVQSDWRLYRWVSADVRGLGVYLPLRLSHCIPAMVGKGINKRQCGHCPTATVSGMTAKNKIKLVVTTFMWASSRLFVHPKRPVSGPNCVSLRSVAYPPLPSAFSPRLPPWPRQGCVARSWGCTRAVLMDRDPLRTTQPSGMDRQVRPRPTSRPRVGSTPHPTQRVGTHGRGLGIQG